MVSWTEITHKEFNPICCDVQPLLNIKYVGGVRVTYKTSFGLDDWIYLHLMHTTRDLQAILHILTVHRYTRTRVLSLH
jgi:hypothetical protein